MQQLEDEDELAYSAEETARISDDEKHVDGRPSWMKTLHNSATTWLQLLPESLQVCFVLILYCDNSRRTFTLIDSISVSFFRL